MARQLPAQDAVPQYRVSLLGPFAVYRDGVPLDTGTWQRNVSALMKLLATAPQWRRSRDEVIEILWPDASSEAGASNLRSQLHLLRRGLGGGDPSPVLYQRGWLELNRAFAWEIDLSHYILKALSRCGVVWDLQTPPARAYEVSCHRGLAAQLAVDEE